VLLGVRSCARQLDPEDRQIVEGMLEGMILKHQAKRLLGVRQLSTSVPAQPMPAHTSAPMPRVERGNTPKRRASR